MLERLRKWLHDDVAEPIAEKFDELEARLKAVEVKLGLREETPHAAEEGKEPEGDLVQHQDGDAGGQASEAGGGDSHADGGEGSTEGQEVTGNAGSL